MKLLLHACCAPCSVQCVESLAAEDIRPDLFWFNPNIHPYTEYRSRRDALCVFSGAAKLSLIEKDEYALRAFIKGALSAEEKSRENSGRIHAVGKSAVGKDAGGRCGFCYRLRLEKTAGFAAENSYEAFSTTLLISPYQNHDLIRQTGEELAAEYGVEFLYRDFRPRFREGQKQARDAGYYMQKYCGCIFSEEERYLGGGRT